MHLFGQIFEESWWFAWGHTVQLHLNFEFMFLIRINQLLQYLHLEICVVPEIKAFVYWNGNIKARIAK